MTHKNKIKTNKSKKGDFSGPLQFTDYLHPLEPCINKLG
jgi:hypothetical protein